MDEVMRIGPRDGVSALREEERDLACFLCPCTCTEKRPCEGTGRRRPSASQEESPHQEVNLLAS